MDRSKLNLVSVYLTYLIDMLGWSIIFPIFAPFFLDPDNVVFSSDVSLATRTMFLGLFLMSFSLGQFLGAPIIGEYGDRRGRRKALILSVFFMFIGMSLSAWSMMERNLPLLFAGRMISGIFASSTSICLACITDFSTDDKTKVKYFGYLSVIGGLSFVLGAFWGGKLSDSTIDPNFNPSLPLWIASGMTLANLFFVLFAFRETAIFDPSVKYDFFESFKNIRIALKTEKIKKIYIIYFLFLFAWTTLFQFIPVLMIDLFSFTNSDIGDLALFMGICWIIGSGYLNQLLILHFSSLRILEFCLICFTIFCTLLIFPIEIYSVTGLLGLCVILGGVGWPICTGLISSAAPQEIQGKVLGMSQSIQSLAMAVAPAIGGIGFHVSLGFPFLIGSGASLIAAIVYFSLKDRRASPNL